MHRKLRRIKYALLILFFISCTPQSQPPTKISLYVYRFDPPAFVELTADFAITNEIPFTIPRDCGLLDIYSAPVGKYLLIELGCPNGQTVLFLDTDSGAITQPVTDTDSHFLAWANDGRFAYLRVDSFGNARVTQVAADGKYRDIDITGWTYDLAARPASSDFIYAFSGGLGLGSELTLVQRNGRDSQQLYVDLFHYISFARFSPDGSQIAFIKIPDSPTPFTVGELWVMNADGTQPRKLAEVDAGHGYAANWSPDGTQIAFVKRENPEQALANESAESLISNIYIVDVASGALTQVTHLAEGHGETPHWSPDGNTLLFRLVLNGRMDVQIAELDSGQVRSLGTEPACCPAWVRK